MNKKTILLLIVATALVLVGGILFCIAMTGLNWDFTKLSTVKYETNVHPIGESVHNIIIVTDTADIQLVAGETASVTCYESENAKHTVAVRDGSLYIEVKNESKWYEQIGINFGTPKITICIPRGIYGNIQIKGSTGDVKIPSGFQFSSMDIKQSTGDVNCQAYVTGAVKISASTGNIHLEKMDAISMELSVSTGRITLQDVNCVNALNIQVTTGKVALTSVSCQSLETTGDTGDLSLQHVIAQDHIIIERSTGDVTFDRCDAEELFIKTDTGDVTGTLLSDKVFVYETDTGRVKLPETTTGGKCEIITDTGNIHIEIKR